MSTRSMIGKVNADNTFTAIYCHSDGYLSYNGAILLGHWADTEKIQALMDLGDISSLGTVIGEEHSFDDYEDMHDGERWCKAYGRDRGEKNVGSKTFDSFKDFCDKKLGDTWCEYLYVMSADGTWHYAYLGDRGFTSIEELTQLTKEEIFDYATSERIIDIYQDQEVAMACEIAGWDVPEDVAERLADRRE